MSETQTGKSDSRPRGEIVTLWCPTCMRSRFGMRCPECGGALVLETFVLESVAEDRARSAYGRGVEGAPFDV